MHVEGNRFFMPGEGWVLIDNCEEMGGGQFWEADVVELSRMDKQVQSIMMQERTPVRGPHGQPMVDGYVISPTRCYGALPLPDPKPIPGIQGGIIRVESVVGWEYEDEKLRPPLKAQPVIER